ncbi:MAG: zinc-dependent metalloprotease [Cyclobacteriaceae bacterium]
MRLITTRIIALSLFSIIMLLSINSEAQLFGKKKKAAKKEAQKKKPKPQKKIADAVKSSTKIDGLFTLYQDTIKGTVKMEISADQINKEFIHFYYIENGVLESNAIRGQYRGSRIIEIKKYFNKIEFAIQNTSYYFDPEETISKASEANITDAIIYSTEIKAGSEKEGAYLIEVDKLFLTDAFGFIKLPGGARPNPKAFKLGRLSSGKTKYSDIHNYPENTDIVVDYVYENAEPKVFGSDAIVDARNIVIKAQHSLIAVPENNFEPRLDDPRIGYFMTKVTDLTSKSSTPYRDLIDRWHLEKKYPDSAISEPIEPIIWWMENTTPIEIRPIVEKAALTWNEAFEKAGFKNALVIKQQPDTAKWDAGDIRYNVLRWTSSPNLAFGGYGPNFVNPKTGQVLGSDVMLEYAVLGNITRVGKVFAKAGYADFAGNDAVFNQITQYCAAENLGLMENAFGIASSSVLEDDPMEIEQIKEEFIYYLILHELGHTLGLNHNMMASQLHGLDDIHNEEVTRKIGLTGSVMDYPSINFAKNRDEQGQYWTTKPGPYDLWAIEFGYKPDLTEEERNKLLARSTEPELRFGNDADDMRAPGKAIDPRINVGDMSSDAIDFATQRIELGREVLEEVMSKYGNETNKSYNDLRIAYLIASGQQFSSASTISRYVGGVYLDRAFIGQDGGTKPFTPVERETQVKAMKALNKYFFAPDAFETESEIFNYLQTQRRGFDHFSSPEDPKLHSRFLGLQTGILAHLLHANVMNRMIDTELYGNEYSLSEMMTDLHKAIFSADAYKSVNSIRQNLQVEYVKKLSSILNSKGNAYMHVARSMALYNLKSARTIASRQSGDIATKAHRQHLAYLIDQALDED